MFKKNHKPTPQWKEEIDGFLYYNKRERESALVVIVCIMSMLANKANLAFEFVIFMYVFVPILFIVLSLLDYRQHLKQLKKSESEIDVETNWNDEDGLPF